MISPCTAAQEVASALPRRVLAPGAGVAAVTREAAQKTGLPTGCLICTGTTGERLQPFGGQTAGTLISLTRGVRNVRLGGILVGLLHPVVQPGNRHKRG